MFLDRIDRQFIENTGAKLVAKNANTNMTNYTNGQLANLTADLYQLRCRCTVELINDVTNIVDSTVRIRSFCNFHRSIARCYLKTYDDYKDFLDGLRRRISMRSCGCYKSQYDMFGGEVFVCPNNHGKSSTSYYGVFLANPVAGEESGYCEIDIEGEDDA